MICLTVISTIHGLWPVEKFAELADVLIGSGEMASDVCLFAWNFSMRRSTVITVVE